METNANSGEQAKPILQSNRYESFDAYYTNRLTALTNASDADIVTLVAKAGYPPDMISSKMAELEDLKKMDDIQKKEYGEQYQATAYYDELAASLHPTYLDDVNWGKLIFKNDLAALNSLGLKGKRLRPESSYCNQALLFYEGVLSNSTYKAAMEARGITTDLLESGRTGFTNLKKMIPKKAKETGESQQATNARDKAWEKFDKWFVEFKKYAVLALGKTPQLREKLGWKE